MEIKIKVGALLKSKNGGLYNTYMVDRVSGNIVHIRNIATGRTVMLMNEKDYARYVNVTR